MKTIHYMNGVNGAGNDHFNWMIKIFMQVQPHLITVIL